MRSPRAARAILAALLLTLAAAPVLAAPAPVVTVLTRDGRRHDWQMARFDATKLRFSFREGKQEIEHWLASVEALEFGPQDSTSLAALPEPGLDVFVERTGRVSHGIFRRMDKDDLWFQRQDGSEAEVKWATLRRIGLARDVLDVDRRQFGRGFNLFGNEAEVALSALFANQVTGDAKPVEDPAILAYVNRVGQAVAATSKRPDLPYSFTVIDSKEVNAFTVGGGRVFLYRGLLERMKSESELAGVLAHEIGHNVGRHTARQFSQDLLFKGAVEVTALLAAKDDESRDLLRSLGGALVYFRGLKYSRDDEREADFLAVYNLQACGVDPHGMIGLFETLQKQQEAEPSRFEVFFQTHPSLEERIENTTAELPKLRLATPAKDSPEFHEMQARLLALPRPKVRGVISSDTLQVAGLSRERLVFDLKGGELDSLALTIRFRAYGGTGNDIRMLVLDETNYLNFVNGHRATPLLDSGVLTTQTFKVPVHTTGKHYVVFDNMFSMFTPKTVVCSVEAEFEER